MVYAEVHWAEWLHSTRPYHGVHIYSQPVVILAIHHRIGLRVPDFWSYRVQNLAVESRPDGYPAGD